jgi:hypothetical protein
MKKIIAVAAIIATTVISASASGVNYKSPEVYSISKKAPESFHRTFIDKNGMFVTFWGTVDEWGHGVLFYDDYRGNSGYVPFDYQQPSQDLSNLFVQYPGFEEELWSAVNEVLNP